MSVIVFSMTGNSSPCATSPQAVRNAMGLNTKALPERNFSITACSKIFHWSLVETF